jgi:hypothetical protein
VVPHYRTKVPPQPLLWSRPHRGTTVSQKKWLTWGKLGVYTYFTLQLIWSFWFCAMY